MKRFNRNSTILFNKWTLNIFWRDALSGYKKEKSFWISKEENHFKQMNIRKNIRKIRDAIKEFKETKHLI